MVCIFPVRMLAGAFVLTSVCQTARSWKGGQTVHLKAGEELRISADGTPGKPAAVDLNSITRWWQKASAQAASPR
jgi:hypothetical protein